MSLIRFRTGNKDNETVVRQDVSEVIAAYRKAEREERFIHWATVIERDGSTTSINGNLVLDLLDDRTVADLRLAVGGEEADDWEMLVWRAGELRRRTEDAHAALDTLGAPREPRDTLAARIRALGGRYPR